MQPLVFVYDFVLFYSCSSLWMRVLAKWKKKERMN